MKVRLGTIEVSDERRLAIAAYNGGKGLATRKEVLRHTHAALDAYFVDIEFDAKQRHNWENDDEI